ncbi:hypothetical protein NPX13_g2919 [Xylaria arbuscula]|uniref:Uncharacterized protein n=1 Tax=Xylaria arbuscula TaxID=114810 RepID=A0A9W8NJH2_9PEZI|nr:hypothetical protein NPX13_g2919 [Xylaria arbuscula]
MKAVRHSAALPSLSLSIPPSPAQAMMRPEGPVEEFSLTGERTKTVTFSEPEEEDLSENSSICQSPSWEQYGQKKKDKKKQQRKGPNQKDTTEKTDAALKRKPNRLSKLPPHNPLVARSLTVSDRSISAPELVNSAQSNKMNPSFVANEMQGALGKHPTSKAESALLAKAKDKRKSKGFLSGLRLQHGNVAAVQKLVDARKDATKGPEVTVEDEPLRSIQYETIPVQPTDISKPRRPPSIRSVISTSDHSLSSQEKRSSGSRTSTGSGHGRSQSLLTSTLNKLRGPSYLYHQPLADGSTSDHSKNIEQANPVGQSTQHVESSLHKAEHAQPFDFAFPPKPRRVNTEPGPDIAPRGRQPRLRKVDIQPPHHDREDPTTRRSDSRRVQIQVPQASARDTVMAMVAAQERQSQATYSLRQTRPNVAIGNSVSGASSHQRAQYGKAEGSPNTLRDQNSYVDQSSSLYATDENVPSQYRVAGREWTAAVAADRTDGLDVKDRKVPEDDQMSVDTYTSTIRPTSNQNTSRLDNLEYLVNQTASKQPELQKELIGEKSIGDLITFERDMPEVLQQPLQPEREVDYFSSFSQSYSPPLLNLRSPNYAESPSTQQLPSPEESDEDGGHAILRDHLRDIKAKQRSAANERDQMAIYASSRSLKEANRTPSEPGAKNSPAISTQYSDSDVPAFERLGLSAKAAKILVGAEMGSTSTSLSQQTDPSGTTSERSSSSTCDDSPPSPSSTTTPESSRPSSQKGLPLSELEAPPNGRLQSASQTEIAGYKTNIRDQAHERVEATSPRRTDMEVGVMEDNWTEASAAIDLKQHLASAPIRSAGLVIGSSSAASPISVSFANVPRQNVDREGELGASRHYPVPPLPPRTQSALDLRSTTKAAQQSSRPQRLDFKSNVAASSVSLPSSPPDVAEMPRKSALKMSRNNSTNGTEPSIATSMGAAYLQEARKNAPVASASSSRALRPHFSQNNSTGSIRSVMSAGNRGEPLAKMLVECCNCHFFHDMPSRVYECMAKPDSVVEDKSLGVSAAITTMVRCPWCSHGMTTQCCSGFAAVVYLKEKLHGK